MLNNEIKIAALISYMSIFISIIIGFITTPLILRALAESEYGVYMLFGSLIATLTMFDLGLNNTIVRYVSRFRAEDRDVEQSQFLGLIVFVYAVISMLLLLLGVGLYHNLSNFFPALSPQELVLAKDIFIILIISLAISIPGGMFTAITNAYERFIFVKGINLLKLILRTLLLFAVLDIYGSAISIVLMDFVFTILTIVVMGYYCFIKIKIKIKISFNFSMFKDIFSYTIWIFLFAIQMRIQWESGKLILGNSSGTTSIVNYSIGLMLALFYSSIATTILGMLLPQANKLLIEKDGLNKLLTTGKKVSLDIFNMLAPVIVLFLVFGVELIGLWLGKGYENIYFITLTIMLLFLPTLMQGFMSSILEAYKKVKIKSLINIFTGTCGMIVSIILAPIYNEFGVLLGLSIGWIFNLIILNVYYLKIKISAYTFLIPSLKDSGRLLSLFIVLLLINKVSLDNCILQATIKLSCSLFIIAALYLKKYISIFKVKY